MINGWAIFAHPLFLSQVERLIATIKSEQKKQKSPRTASSPSEKLLAAILDSAFVRIPRNPNDSHFRQSHTLGAGATHWFRDKFFNGRFRLFFRFQSQARVIVITWVNDAETLRTYGSRADAYAVFRRMLETGNPPNDWSELLAQASSRPARTRAEKLVRKRK